MAIGSEEYCRLLGLQAFQTQKIGEKLLLLLFTQEMRE